jgi:hypothetical protein
MVIFSSRGKPFWLWVTSDSAAKVSVFPWILLSQQFFFEVGEALFFGPPLESSAAEWWLLAR